MESSTVSLSVCIPVYNQDVRALVDALRAQSLTAPLPVEILVADDGSDDFFRNVNKNHAIQSGIRYFQLDRNEGRSFVRNFLGSECRTSHILFLDGDSVIENLDFLCRYGELIGRHPDTVLCGGTYFRQRRPDRSISLHYKYGIRVVAHLHSKKDKQGRFHFMSSNFVMPADVFRTVGFDLRLRGYGHEDTVFGYELDKRNIPVVGVDNTVLHNDLDTNDVFLDKIRQSVHNLNLMQASGDYGKALSSVRLVRIAEKLRSAYVAGIYRGIFRWLEKPVISNLQGGRPSLFLLQLYKLYLILKKKG